MTGSLNTAPPDRKPSFWYGLPHGYLKLDLEPSGEGLREVARHLESLPDEARHRAEQVFRLYAIIVSMLQRQRVQGCALGMHPDENGEPLMSVLTVSTLPTPEGNPKAALTRMLTGSSGTGSGTDVVPVKLPMGTGFLFESEQRAVAPSAPPEGQEEPMTGTVWQGTVAIPDTRSASVIIVQLVTPSVQLADDYRGVLLGVARTVTITDPAVPTGTNGGTGPSTAPGSRPETRSPFG